MDIKEVYSMVGNFKNMNLNELNITLTNMYRLKKRNEEQYNELVTQLFFIIHKLQKEIERKLPIELDLETDSETDDDDKVNNLINSYDVRLIDVWSDEE